MENYQISGSLISNYPYGLNNSFLYPPIIFYDPTLTFIPQHITPFHLNFTPNCSPSPPKTAVTDPVGLPYEIS